MFWLNIPVLIITNTAGNRPKVSFKISSAVTLTNAETQTQAANTGLGALSTQTPPTSPSCPDMKVRCKSNVEAIRQVL